MATVYKALSRTNGDAEKDKTPSGARKHKQRVLILSSRGVTYRHRHLLNDIAAMLPHGRKDAKFDSKSNLFQLNELAELYNCNNVLYKSPFRVVSDTMLILASFFEARKGQDLYVWMSKVPNGPTCKMHLQNLHTASELHFSGNCLKGSRPVLSFDAAFEKEPYLRVVKELFLHIFGVPQGARKSKPFVDHVLGFSVADGKIWIRNYQINEVEKAKASGDEPNKAKSSLRPATNETDINLVEIGPRFVLTPIIIQEGSFGGPILYQNKTFVSPNQVRADLRRKKAGRSNVRAEKELERLAKKGELGLRTKGGRKAPTDELDKRILFA